MDKSDFRNLLLCCADCNVHLNKVIDMNLAAILMEMVAFAALFTAIVLPAYRGDKKYSAAAIHNYPPDIQEE